MNRSTPTATIMLAALLCALLVGCSQGPRVGAPAPPLDVRTWVNAPGEEPMCLERLSGKPVLLEFWSRDCGPCVREIPNTKRLCDRHADDGLQLVTVHIELGEPDASATRAFIAEQDIRYPVGLGDIEVLEEFGITALPYALLLDHAGVIRWSGNLVWADAVPWNRLDANIQSHLAEHNAAPGRSTPRKKCKDGVCTVR